MYNNYCMYTTVIMNRPVARLIERGEGAHNNMWASGHVILMQFRLSAQVPELHTRWPTTLKKNTILHAVAYKFLSERGGAPAPPCTPLLTGLTFECIIFLSSIIIAI